ncbi:MAG TPA: hypothetical protein VKK81_13075, partial [Candidatus Binatia bacterium]|nr:hypothetical protein [Candidatus Binatia bacterium]
RLSVHIIGRPSIQQRPALLSNRPTVVCTVEARSVQILTWRFLVAISFQVSRLRGGRYACGLVQQP